MADLGKTIIVIGLAIALLGALLLAAGKLGFRGMPGDVAWQGGNVRFYFPIVTCIVLSLLLTLGLWFFRWLTGR